MNDLTFLPAVAMAEQIRTKNLSPVELVEAHLAQIERLNPRMNAFVHVDAERVRQSAVAVRSALRLDRVQGLFHGQIA